MAKAKAPASATKAQRPIDRLKPAARAAIRANAQRFIAYATQRRIARELAIVPMDIDEEDEDQDLEFLPGELKP